MLSRDVYNDTSLFDNSLKYGNFFNALIHCRPFLEGIFMYFLLYYFKRSKPCQGENVNLCKLNNKV